MEAILDNIFFISLCIVMSMMVLVGYIRLIRSGEIISKHSHKNLGKKDIVFYTLLVPAFAYVETNIFGIPIKATPYFALYLVILFIMNGHPIITTAKGFFFKGQFIKWASIMEFDAESPQQIKMRKLTAIYMDIKIKGISDFEGFKDMVCRYGVCGS